jgi:hypothetical protein
MCLVLRTVTKPAITVDDLRGIRAFAELQPADIERLMGSARIVEFQPGDSIIRRGEAGDSMYGILSGRVLITVPDEGDGQNLLRQLGPGRVFGEMALLTGDPRSADVEVYGEAPCRCLVVSKEGVDHMVRAHPSVAAFLTQILGDRLIESNAMRQVGKYRILWQLAQGGMAWVYEAVHTEIGHRVAIKMLSHHLVCDEGFAERFADEARVIASLNHPNIVRIVDLEEAYLTRFIVMEKLVGTDLHSRMTELGPMDFDLARKVVIEASRALHHAHEAGVVHRDVKPGNIFLELDGNVKLLDFGIAVSMREIATGLGGSAYTPSYAAPELARGERVDQRIDIYALGLTLDAVLTGSPYYFSEWPHEALQRQIHEPLPDPRKRIPGIPEDLAQFIERSTAKERDDRFHDCAEVVRFFEEAGTEESKRNLKLAVRVDPAAEPGVRARLSDLAAELLEVDGVRSTLVEG